MELQFDNHGRDVHPAILLIHGFPFDRQIWQDQLDLAERFRIVRPDLPGFGSSPLKVAPEELTIEHMADSVKDVLDSLDIAKATVLGHSMGGYVALALADRYPDRVERLGLIASHPFADDEEARRQRMDTIERVKDEGPQVVPAAMRENLFSSNTMDERPSIITGVYAIMKNATSEAIIGALHAMAARPDRTHVLASFERPLLVVAGKKDRILPLARVDEYAGALDECDFHVFKHSGHMPMMEESRRFNEIVAGFVKDSDGSRVAAQA